MTKHTLQRVHQHFTPDEKAKAEKHAKSEREKTLKDQITNSKFSQTNTTFIDACQEAGVQPTARQASKWRNKCGAAYKEWKKLNVSN